MVPALLIWLLGTFGAIAVEEVYRSVLTAGFGVSSISDLVTPAESATGAYTLPATTRERVAQILADNDWSRRQLDPKSCPHTPVPQLVADIPAIQVGNTNSKLRTAPGTSAGRNGSIYPGERVIILSGPMCADEYYWYKMRTRENKEGWAAEADPDTINYWFVAVLDHSVCDLPPRFAPGDTATYSSKPSNNVRKRPIRTAVETDRDIFPGEIVEVLIGPVCSDYHIWYWVQNEELGIEGWTAEGFDDEYWFEKPKRFSG